ncbi:MAG TPA: hypothetical protein VNL77_18960, partial [Roseiflexaceae bacterium]|nr:hypothetical protein [Roseiflexaceae bacterium]
MRTCVCLDAVAAGLPLEAALEAAAAAQGIEIWDWRRWDVAALGSRAASCGLPVVALSGNTFEEPLVDPDAHPRALAHLARSIEAARRLGAAVLVAHTGYAIAGRSRPAQW